MNGQIEEISPGLVNKTDLSWFDETQIAPTRELSTKQVSSDLRSNAASKRQFSGKMSRLKTSTEVKEFPSEAPR